MLDKDAKLSNLLSQWPVKNRHLYHEVDLMIERLDLKNFKEQESPPGASQEPTVIEAKPEPLPHLQEGAQPEVIELRPKQRRLSLDLMQMKAEHGESRKGALQARKSSFSKPALISTTNVNVITRAEANPKPTNSKMNLESPKRSIFKDMLKKLKLSLIKKNRQQPKMPIPQIIVAPRRQESRLPLSNNNGPFERGSRDDVLEARKQKRDGELPLMKQSRRASLVGENLPSYIREQLQRAGSDTPETPTVPEILTNRAQKVTRPKEKEKTKPLSPNSSLVYRSRLQNLLATSQSLYAHNKDLESIKSGNIGSNAHSSNTSGYEIEGTNKSTSEEGDEDKEYILPTLVTKLYGADANEADGEQILRDLGDDDTYFLNVNDSYDDLIEENGENDNNDDDYLFAA